MRILEHPNPNELVFEMVNIDVSFANALRRIMIAEVPTVAIEMVHMWNNTSIVHDEVLAHRLGLVPIDCDPRYLDDFDENDEDPTERNTIVFRMKVTCGKSKKRDESKDDDEDDDTTHNKNSKKSKEKAANNSVSQHALADSVAASTAVHLLAQPDNTAAIDTPGRPYTRHVYSRDLKWVPQGSQEETMFPDGGVRPVHEDILLAKLRPGQTVELEAHASRGQGKEHAKFSPVATACYRLMPQIELVRPVYDEHAEELDVYEPGVFRIVTDLTPEELSQGHTKKAVVHNPYACTMSRNYMRNPQLKDSVKITRLPNHFIFSIESVGMMPASVVLAESLRVLKAKCQNLMRMVDEYTEGDGIVA